MVMVVVVVAVVIGIGILGVWGIPIDLGGLGASLEIKDKLSYTITLIICGWTIFTFFRSKENAKVLEKVKFLNQKDLESYKIYNSKKKEFILEFTADLTECLYILNGLDPVIKRIRDWGKIEKDEIKYILQLYDIHEYDRKYLVELFEMKKPKNCQLMNEKILEKSLKCNYILLAGGKCMIYTKRLIEICRKRSCF